MSSVNYEELAENAQAVAKLHERLNENSNECKLLIQKFINAKMTGRAIEKAQTYYQQLYGTLLEEIEDTGAEMSMISTYQMREFAKSVANTREYEANTDILSELRQEEVARKQSYEQARDAFLASTYNYSGEYDPYYYEYCSMMANYYQELASYTQQIIDRLTAIIDGIYTFEAECSGLYDSVLARLDVLESICEELGVNAVGEQFTVSEALQEKLDTVSEALNIRKLSAMLRGSRIEIVGEEATERIGIDREAMCTEGVTLVYKDAYYEESCAWFASKVLNLLGKIDMVKSTTSTENGKLWWCNTEKNTIVANGITVTETKYLDGSDNFINANGMCDFFSEQSFTTTYQIKGTTEEKVEALKVMQEAGLYKDGDLLFFDKEGNGEQNHVVILNGQYDHTKAIGEDCNPGSEKYDGQPAFFAQNDNHKSFSVMENLISHPKTYTESTVLTVVAFNG